MTKSDDRPGSTQKDRISDDIDSQIREYLRRGGKIEVISQPERNINRSRGSVWQTPDDDVEFGI